MLQEIMNMTLNEYQIQENFSKDSNFFVASDVEGHKCVILKNWHEPQKSSSRYQRGDKRNKALK